MSNTLNLVDRLRIERVVWTVGVLVSDLPHRSQRAVRRELRDNLRAAASEAGVSAAVRGLGGLRHLAAGYLEAEYGDSRPRPRWLRGVAWAMVVYLVFVGIMFVGNDAFISGVLAANPRATGTYSWTRLGVWGPGLTVTMSDGQVSSAVLKIAAPILLYFAVAYLLGARVWRLPAPWRRR